MKTPIRILAAVCCIAAPITFACGPVPAGVAAAAPPAEPPAMTYDTAAMIAGMPRFTGTVLEKFPCCARVCTADGTKLWIGSPAATSEVVRFVATLRECEDYVFPDAFLDWQKREQPRPVPMPLAGVSGSEGKDRSGLFRGRVQTEKAKRAGSIIAVSL